jgi:hypothetical protein
MNNSNGIEPNLDKSEGMKNAFDFSEKSCYLRTERVKAKDSRNG